MAIKFYQPSRSKGRHRQPRLSRSRLQVEPLESRCLMSFQVLATLGDPVAGAGFRINDFEPNGLNNRGDVLYGDDLGTANDPATFYGEGIFLRSQGQETLLARTNTSAPGGGTYDFGFLGPSALNDSGDVAYAFTLQPAGSPFGVHAGTYRFSHTTETVTPVVVPDVTPAPTGGKFAGTFFAPSMDNHGDVLFTGIVPTDKGVHFADEPYVGLGLGVFRADKNGHISSVVVPGDAAPGGGAFDAAGEYGSGPWVNDEGNIVFVGHVAGQEARVPGFPPQAAFISTLGSLYVRDGQTGRIQSIAHSGDPAPGGGAFRQALFPEINAEGDILFTGDLTSAPDANQVLGVFMVEDGRLISIARPGDAMPGGGHFVTASVVGGNIHLNNKGDAVFNGVLDTDVNGYGTKDTGLFQWSDGHLSLIARTGTVLPGVGTVKNLVMGQIVVPPPPILVPNSDDVNNDKGQILFGATLTDGRQVLLLYTPPDAGDHGGGGNGHGSVMRKFQPPDAATVTILANKLAAPPGTASITVAVRPASSGVQLPVLSVGDNGSRLSVSSQGHSAIAGTRGHAAVDAVFAGQGQLLDDPFANGTF